MADDFGLGERVAAVRRFNRFYTRRIGILDESLLATPFSLAEMRVLWEIATAPEGCGASQLEHRLGIDPSYLSRIVKGFRQRGYVKAEGLDHDARMRAYRITPAGKAAFAQVDRAAAEAVREELHRLPERDQFRLAGAMGLIEDILEGRTPRAWTPVVLRQPRAGDFGWVVSRHGAIYAQEHRFDASFEALVAEIVAKFVREYRPAREHAWIAERGDERAGCVFLVQRSATVCQLRLLLVEPTARGLGIGRTLVDECVAFGRMAGYRKMVLWTQGILAHARRIYERAGFRLAREEAHRSFGRRLRGEHWELTL